MTDTLTGIAIGVLLSAGVAVLLVSLAVAGGVLP